MKIKFIRECKDKNTGARYHIGDELVFPGTRAEEILSTGYAVKVEETQEDTEEVIDTETFEKMNVAQLKKIAEEKGIDTKKLKNKAAIIAAILDTIK